MKRTVFCLALTLLLAGTIFLACDIRPARSDYVWTETIYINADGSVNPVTAPISTVDNVTYTLTDNIVGNVPNGSSGIDIQRNNTIIDGAGYTLQGTNVPDSWGINLSGSSNVTIKNMKITEFYYGIYLGSSSNNSVSGNDITANTYGGIGLYSSSNNNVVGGNNITANNYGILQGSSSSDNNFSGNDVTANNYGIWLWHSFDSSISRNVITNNGLGIGLDSRSSNDSVSGNDITANNGTGVQLSANCSDDNVSGNDITANGAGGVFLASCNDSSVSGNNITANDGDGIELYSSFDNTIYHNNILNNTSQAHIDNSTSTWDNGYPSGGNYWSDYNGTDMHSGLYQNATGSDGIGDTAYVIDTNNRDHYPLMGWFGPSTPAGLNVTVFPSDDLGLIFQSVTVAGSTGVNEMPTYAPALSNLTGEYYAINVLANYSGNIIVRLIFNGSGLTQDQENRLMLMQYTPLVGDITGPGGVPDGKVDIRDIALIAKAFGTSPGQPGWNPICDLNGDGKINIIDISLAAKNFGKTSSWVNITTSVDTTSNVIYGITTHFSIIGIHQE